MDFSRQGYGFLDDVAVGAAASARSVQTIMDYVEMGPVNGQVLGHVWKFLP